jgi:hypothetical protein
MQKRFIYGLFDPRNPDVVMVVGETKKRLSYRRAMYVAHAKYKSAKGRRLVPSERWVVELLMQGVEPGIKLLARTSDTNWRSCERRFITIWRKKNPRLLNVHDGGNGPCDGAPTVLCKNCGAKKVQWADGSRGCRTCKAAGMRRSNRKLGSPWNRLPSKRKYMSGYNRVNKVKHRRYWRRVNNSKAGRAAHKKWYKANGAAYFRDRYQAKKVGLTVAEYRQRLAA